jgi:hypothetical protein
MADQRCYRCVYRSEIGPRPQADRLRCVPVLKDGGADPFWAAKYRGRGEKVPVFEDMNGGHMRLSDSCLCFKEGPSRG